MLPWRQLRDESIERLRAAGIDDPEQEVRWIIERASGHSPSEQARVLDDPVTEREVRFVDEMVARRAEGEPLQYVLGRWGFRTLDLLVDPRVLIPRPETEVVAGLAIDALDRPRGGGRPRDRIRGHRPVGRRGALASRRGVGDRRLVRRAGGGPRQPRGARSPRGCRPARRGRLVRRAA